MTVIIGGAGSSGTTLLRNLLHRQPDIYSGPEMNFLNKRMLFDDWGGKKTLIATNSRRLETGGWFPYPGTRIFDEALGWSRPEIVDLIDASKSVTEFASMLFSRPIAEKGARIWIEKTPSNAYCFSNFLGQSSDHKCILVCRNPFDAVASLVNRGLSEYFAAGLWLHNTASAMQSVGSPRVMTLFYERLIDDPQAELARILSFISLDPSRISLDAEEERSSSSEGDRSAAGFAQWQHDPRGRVQKPQSSTFERLPETSRNRIVSALNRVEVSVDKKQGFFSAREVAQELGYEWQEEELSFKAGLRWQMLADISRRSVLRYSTGFFNYPGRLR